MKNLITDCGNRFPIELKEMLVQTAKEWNCKFEILAPSFQGKYVKILCEVRQIGGKADNATYYVVRYSLGMETITKLVDRETVVKM